MWKYESSDHQNISLHDHFISNIILQKNDILLIFKDGFDVVKTHPLNDTQKSKHTTESQIIIKNSQFLKGIVCPFNREDKALDFSTLLNDLEDFEVLEFKVENNELSFFGNLNTSEFKSDYSELLFSCSDVIFCWNDYSCDAWFEGWSKRTFLRRNKARIILVILFLIIEIIALNRIHNLAGSSIADSIFIAIISFILVIYILKIILNDR